MSEIAEEAVQATIDGVDHEYVQRCGFDRNVARAALTAAAPILAAQERADERRKYEDLLGAIWLYIGWRYVTRQLTTEQKNLFADAVDAYWRRGDASEGEESSPVDRWWTDEGEARDPR